LSGIPSPLPCVVFALAREAMYFRRAYRPRCRIPGAPCRAWLAGPVWRTVLLLESGLGARPMEAALSWLLAGPTYQGASLRPNRVLLAGFAGGLVEELRVGDVILAEEVRDADGRSWTVEWPGVLSLALPRGRLLTVPHLVTDPDEKRRLGQLHQALAVDMESAVAARQCREAGVSFGCVRVISDDWRTPLSPRLTELLRDGRVSAPRLLGALLRRPWLVVELWRLARQTRLAAWRLADVLRSLLN
jgi:adenosylhomocysteine nucleosidase